jgi:hypothetical protein
LADRKGDLPESLSQARAWDRCRAKYAAAGLCDACAAQAAWGHQIGFGYVSTRPWLEADRRIKAPCESCAPIVAAFPAEAGKDSPWRRFRFGDRPDPAAGEMVTVTAGDAA